MMGRNSKIALATLIAAGAGYVGGLLSAPRSGKETRKKIAKSASKVRIESEKQLKKLHSDLNGMITNAEKQLTGARTKANNELREAIKSAKEARQKAKMLLTALHQGDADDPHLKAAVKEVAAAKAHLAKFVKSNTKSTKKTKTKSKK